MKRVLIVAAVAAVGLAAGALRAEEKSEGQQAGAEHKQEQHAERHQRMAEHHARMAEHHARHGEHRHGDADKPAAQPKPEEHKH